MSEPQKQLDKLIEPAPSYHFDERMNWTIADIQHLFPTGRFTAQLPLVIRRSVPHD